MSGWGTGGWALGGVVVAGLGSLTLSGTPGLVLALAAGVALLLPAPRLGQASWALVHTAILVITGVTAWLGPPTFAFAILVAWLLAHRRWMGRTGDDARVALLLATLLLLLGAVSTESILLAPLFVIYVGLLPVALLRAEMLEAELETATTARRRPRVLEGLVALGATVLTAILFVVLPRADGGYAGGSQGLGARFPDDVTLGLEGTTPDEGAEVMRLRVTDPSGASVSGPFHVRGRAYDRFDGVRWSIDTPIERPPAVDWTHRAEIELEPIGDVLFGLPDVLRIEGVPAQVQAGGVFTAGFGARRSGSTPAGYRAYSRNVPLAAVDTTDVAPWLQLPEVDPRLRPLAWMVAADEGDPAVVAQALSDWLGTTYTYVATPPSPPLLASGATDPLAWFLFDGRAGHCEYFASALVLLLRQRNIPARLATGFYSDELHADGSVVVRRGNAHAWVEVRTDGGWATLDPTPPSSRPGVVPPAFGARLDRILAAWHRNVVDFDLNKQFAAFGAVGRRVMFAGDDVQRSPVRLGFVGMVTVVGGLIGSLVLFRAVLARLDASPRGRRTLDPLARVCAQARTLVRRKGWALPPELPPVAAAEWLRAHVGDAAAPMERIAELTYRARYGGAPAEPLLAEALSCLRALRLIPRPDRAGR